MKRNKNATCLIHIRVQSAVVRFLLFSVHVCLIKSGRRFIAFKKMIGVFKNVRPFVETQENNAQNRRISCNVLLMLKAF